MKREDHSTRISTRYRLWKEAKGICPYCGRYVPLEKASLDHIIPVNKLDENLGESNLLFCCKRCNKQKLDYIVFTNLFDKIIYPIIDHKYFYKERYIQFNKKDKNKLTSLNS